MITYLSNTCLGAFVQVSHTMSMSVQLSSQLELGISISDCSTSPKQKTTWHGWLRYHHHYSRLGNHGTSDQPYHTWSTHQASSPKLSFSHPCQDKDPTIDWGSLLPSGSPAHTWSTMRSFSCWSFGSLTLHHFGTAVKLAVAHLPWAVDHHTTWKSHKSHHPGDLSQSHTRNEHEMPKLEKSG